MKKNLIIVVAITFTIMGILFAGEKSISYAYEYDEKNWNIYFSNLKTSMLNGDVFVPDGPDIENTTIKAYDVLINRPGDFSSYTFDIVNKGDYDAKLSTLTKIDANCISLNIPGIKEDEESVCNNLEYKISYTKNGKPVKENDIIKAHSRENITLKVGVYDTLDNINNGVQVTLFDTVFVFSKVD